MGSVAHARYQRTREDRFRELMLTWLGTLPGRWSGTAGDLEDQLLEAAAGKAWHFVPRGSALSNAVRDAGPAIEAAGWRVEFTRTAKARTITFTRRSRRLEPERG